MIQVDVEQGLLSDLLRRWRISHAAAQDRKREGARGNQAYAWL
jgi:hypothetical protein